MSHPRAELFHQDLLAWTGEAHLDLLPDYQRLVALDPKSLSRERIAGHFTASALVVDPDAGEVLLLMHPKVNRWLQFGGHIEPVDLSFAEAAVRECREESGYQSVRILPVPAALDQHRVPCAGGTSIHWDVQFLALVDKSSPRILTESLDTRWVGFAQVRQLVPELDLSVQRLIQAAASGNFQS